jgi:hypothetical protein
LHSVISNAAQSVISNAVRDIALIALYRRIDQKRDFSLRSK